MKNNSFYSDPHVLVVFFSICEPVGMFNDVHQAFPFIHIRNIRMLIKISSVTKFTNIILYKAK